MYSSHEFFSSPDNKDVRQDNLYTRLSHMQLAKLRQTNQLMNAEILEYYENFFTQANKALFIFLKKGNLPNNLTTWINIEWVKTNLAFQLYVLKHFTTYPLAIADKDTSKDNGTIYLELEGETLKFTALKPDNSVITGELQLKELTSPLITPLTLEQVEPYKDEIMQIAHKKLEEITATSSDGISIGTGKLYNLVIEGCMRNQFAGIASLFKDKMFQYCYNQNLISYEQLQNCKNQGKAYLLAAAAPLIADGHLGCEELINSKITLKSLDHLLQPWMHPLIKAKGFSACLENYCPENGDPLFLFLQMFVEGEFITAKVFIEKADEWIKTYHDTINTTEYLLYMYRRLEAQGRLNLLQIFSGPAGKYILELKEYIEQRVKQHENKDKSNYEWVNSFSMYCKQSLSIDYLSKTETAQAVIDILLKRPGAMLSDKHLAVLGKSGDTLTGIGDRIQDELHISFSDYSSSGPGKSFQ